MNRIIIPLLLMIVLPALNVHAQQKSIETNIADIRAAFKKINSLSLKQEQFRYESEGCVEDGIIQYYFQDNEIVKIIEFGSIGDGSWKNEYYYESGKFIFSYEMLVGSSAEGEETKSEYRVYAKDGAVIRYMEDQKILPSDSRVTKTLAIAGKLLKAYTTKKFAAVLCE
ncbi:hypothetical protein [Chitinophaga sp. CF118]|uniref:hypothetical protein n=1 Tax=Chitinophaga sp. CF118 TaxID=1884367 RepID=UPI001160703A|nr:hypothetical protein [Chitinophaga sp. CF118]